MFEKGGRRINWKPKSTKWPKQKTHIFTNTDILRKKLNMTGKQWDYEKSY
jgi:hypothetical protein